MLKYEPLIFLLTEKLKFRPATQRILVITVVAMLLVHVFACMFYLQARIREFSPDTWVVQAYDADAAPAQSYSVTMYWAFQTLTTVGYGDFGCYNGAEIILTCIWMFFGVAFYSVVVGSLTSVITSSHVESESLNAKIKALGEFAEAKGMDPELHKRIENFLAQNAFDVFSRFDEEELVAELPASLREELVFQQFGEVVEMLQFLKTFNSHLLWNVVKRLKNITYHPQDRVYEDAELSEYIFLLHKGRVNLYAQNGFPFASFKNGETFGDADALTGHSRCGTAKVLTKCTAYFINITDLFDVIAGAPTLKYKIVIKALQDYKHLVTKKQ